jgi:hypothetical protein
MTSFGFGQRACLGQTLTQDEMLMACGAVCWAYNLKFKIDPKTGQKIDIPVNKSNTLLIIKPDNYEMVFEPRTEQRKQEIISNWKQSESRDKAERDAFARLAKAPKSIPVAPSTEKIAGL